MKIEGKIILAYKRKDWKLFFFMLEGHWRQDFFVLVADEMNTRDYWVAARLIVTGESLYNEELVALLTNPKKDLSMRYLLMRKWERARLKAMPDKLTVYRGYGLHAKGMGWSWSLSPKVASRFARRFSKGYVEQGECLKEDVIAYFSDRNEKEIVVPYNKVKYITTIEFTPSGRVPFDSIWWKRKYLKHLLDHKWLKKEILTIKKATKTTEKIALNFL